MSDVNELSINQSTRSHAPDDLIQERIMEKLDQYRYSNPDIYNVFHSTILQGLSFNEALETLFTLLISQNEKLFDFFIYHECSSEKQIIVTVEETR